MLREYLGLDIHGEAQTWDWNIDEGVSALDWQWLWSEGVKQGLFRYGHMVKGARLGLEALIRQGHTIEIATHRPANAVNDTLDWLSLYFRDIPVSGIHILSNGEPKSSVMCDLLIDDKGANATEWVKSGRPALQFMRPWTSNEPLAWKANGWADVWGVVNMIEWAEASHNAAV
jgi:hypothetical protein